MSIKELFPFLFLLFTATISISQVTVTPLQFTANSDVTISFDATIGNKALEGFDGDIYLHTGVIQGTENNPTGWTYVQGNWGQAHAKVKMNKVGTDRYEMRFNISEFYGIDASESILQLAFVFRDAEGKFVAKTDEEKDIYFPELEILEHGKIEKLFNVKGKGFGAVRSVLASDDGREITLSGETQALTISLKQEGILNFKYFPNGQTLERKSYAEILEAKEILNYHESANSIQIVLGNNYVLKITKSNLIIELEHEEKEVVRLNTGPEYIEEFEGTGPYSILKLKLNSNEHIYGLGSRAMANDRVGERLYVYNKPNYNYVYGEDDVYLSLPYYLSSKGYGFLLDSYSKSVFDIGKYDQSTLEIGTSDDYISFYLLFDKDPVHISKLYCDLTGYQELPPIWALGYFQSRYGYQSQNEVTEIVDKTIKAGFPLDATVLDLYWFGGTSRMGDFDWNRDSFPNPDKLVNDFISKGVKTILITESYVVEDTDYFNELDSLEFFAKNNEGASYVIKSFWCGPAALIDVFIPEVSAWLWNIYKREYQRGVAAWWCDSGEPENHPSEMIHVNGEAEEVHNIYALEWSRIFYENFRNDYPDKRLFNLTRSGYPGMQRFNSVPWSGDVSRTWSALNAQPSIMMGTGICGVPYIHHDIGGFTGTEKDEELYIRWIQLGTFSPVMRVHGDGHMIPPEPIFYSKPTQGIVKKYIKLRYKLLPYNYTLSYEAYSEGKPLVRPMFFHYPNDEIADTINSQFMWGDRILVAPITSKGQGLKKIYLADDAWYDFHSGQAVEKTEWLIEKVGIDDIPILVKAGSFLSLTSEELQSTLEYDNSTMNLHYYYDEDDSSSSVYIDDGETHVSSLDYQFENWNLSKTEDKKWINFSFENTSGVNINNLRQWKLFIHGIDKTVDCVKLNGKKILDKKEIQADSSGDPLLIDFQSTGSSIKLKVKK